MGLFDTLANKLSGKRPTPAAAPVDWSAEVRGELERGAPFDTLAKSLRIKWLQDTFFREKGTEKLDQLLARMKEKFPQQADVIDLFGGIYAQQNDEYYTRPRYERAIELRRQKQWPVEAVLFIARCYMRWGEQTRRYCFLVREEDREAGPFATAELHFFHRLCDAVLFEHARVEGDEALGSLDALMATELACEHSAHAMAALNKLKQRLKLVIGDDLAAKIDGQLGGMMGARMMQTASLLANKAIEPGPAFAAVARGQSLASGKGPPPTREEVLRRVKEAVRDERCSQSSGKFIAIDQQAQDNTLSKFADFVQQVTHGYDGYLPSRELDAELSALNGRHLEAGQEFERLFRKKPSSTFYAFRAGLSYLTAGDAKAGPLLIHASRQAHENWRDKIAASRAALAAFQFEGAALREVFPEKRAECAVQLADRLEQHWETCMNERWDFATAVPLATRIAHLRHLAWETTRQDALYQPALNAYRRIDQDGEAQLRNRAPEDTFDPLRPLDTFAQ